jgi:alkanesulfonate monooxygenase SsuD/methylene tetrahydromethanopterin reductase-like flavin-dependent oxidoreductase (luciferase family)
MWIGGSSDAAIMRTAKVGTGWQGGSEPPQEAGRIVAGIRKAAAEIGRTIDEDHYGVGFPFYFGHADDPALTRGFEFYRRRTGRDPLEYFAIGDADTILEKISDYVAVGVSKFVLRPMGKSDEALETQTRRLIEEVLPEVARRWPRRPKAA